MHAAVRVPVARLASIASVVASVVAPVIALVAASLMLSLLAVGPAGCSKTTDPGAVADERSVPGQLETVSVDELDRMLASHECQAVDANGTETRRRMGVIPGAVLLSDADSADPADSLPRDRSAHLVFYCANDACSASHHAARKAILAGYTHVKVMPDGIAGWVKAGKKTSSI